MRKINKYTEKQLSLFKTEEDTVEKLSKKKEERFSFKAVFSLLFILLSLTLYSYFQPAFSILLWNGKEIEVSFIPFEKLIDFSPSEKNEAADSLISSYLANTQHEFFIERSSLSLIEPKRKNEFLINPVLKNGKTALDLFFNALLTEKDSCLVRIAHYGDSQLEGDRVTNIFRKKFQDKFGGYGQGFVPFTDLTPSISYNRQSGENWMRYTVFNRKYNSGNYGLSGTVYKFTNCVLVELDSSETADNELAAENDSIEKPKELICYDNASVRYKFRTPYDQMRIMYGNVTAKCKLEAFNNNTGELLAEDSLMPGEVFNTKRIPLSSNVLNIKLQFTSDVSPEFYALCFDSYKGVQVDNYAIRGHSGDGLMLINPDILARQLKELNVKLIIFQYGANVVPYIRSEEACQWLKTLYYDLFMRFKQAAPNTGILVIGAGDMARQVEGGYASYSMLPRIRDVQREAALEAGCAFFDLFGMMGGSNSIISWSRKKLASTDGHLSPKGQEILGNELFSALMVEYNMFLYKKKTQQID